MNTDVQTTAITLTSGITRTQIMINARSFHRGYFWVCGAGLSERTNGPFSKAEILEECFYGTAMDVAGKRMAGT